MIDLTFAQDDFTAASPTNDALRRYVRAMLARQQALDLLESIQQQITQIWATMRRFLESTGISTRSKRMGRRAQPAQATEAQQAYRSLEQRREECIAALHDAERRAQAAWQTMLIPDSTATFRKNAESSPSSRAGNSHRNTRGKLEKASAGSC